MAGPELEFEKPILELERKIQELRALTKEERLDLGTEIDRLEARLRRLKKDTFEHLTPWQRVQIARHVKRPTFRDYIQMIMVDFLELHGDRMYGDDRAIIGGLGWFEDQRVFLLGHQKGADTQENLLRNFGMPHPEGYRKAFRLMLVAEKFGLPIVVFVDTPGAYPGVGAEERGQAHSIAHNLRGMAGLRVPILVFVIGEGGSGGALGIGVGDRVCVLQNAYYSVISPEGCAAILWKDRARAPDAARALRLTAKDLLEFGLIDEVVEEPLGGAHRAPREMGEILKRTMKRLLQELLAIPADRLVQERQTKYRRMGYVVQQPAADGS